MVVLAVAVMRVHEALEKSAAPQETVRGQAEEIEWEEGEEEEEENMKEEEGDGRGDVRMMKKD